MSLTLILVDPNPALCAAWGEAFGPLSSASVVQGYFEELDTYDCMVSAANSFGLMNGGVDAAITDYFGPDLMRRVQEAILTDYLGEQPVGTLLLVPTGHPDHPYLAHTPTMRVPMYISRTDYVYTAMWAMLCAVHRHNRDVDHAALPKRRIGTVACPGLGSGVGQMPPRETARQMALAYRHFLDPPSRISWPYAAVRQDNVGRGGDIGFMPRPG